ncbi:hypothetical protein [Lentiprolixibacter aurantiacus]|uniref:Uncharacterized protein n=1 Tax=Lentiprolixibacter aurantiacus TaxID=2993939 RepID=A0AAE3SP77_9FLAO|nr:hypothetical protein [Lentiprolixibacter aurantiacus]MCX2719926.1 hypothetical protein [Lentiprolixibacter aurantiacus]
MKDFRYRPKDQYINEADWQELYVLTEHWLADLTFYAEDLDFLRHIIGKYFMWLSKKEDIDLVREIELSLIEMHHECEDLMKRVEKHLHHLAELIDDPFKYDSHAFRVEHELLEDDIMVFVKKVRKQRKETFSVTNYVVEEEELWDKEEV